MSEIVISEVGSAANRHIYLVGVFKARTSPLFMQASILERWMSLGDAVVTKRDELGGSWTEKCLLTSYTSHC